MTFRGPALAKARELEGELEDAQSDPEQIALLLTKCIVFTEQGSDVIAGLDCLCAWATHCIQEGDPYKVYEQAFDTSIQSRLVSLFWSHLAAERKTIAAKARSALDAFLDLFELVGEGAPSSSSSSRGKAGLRTSKRQKGTRAPPSPRPLLLASLTSRALEIVDRRVSLFVMEILSNRYGIDYLTQADPTLYWRLIKGSEGGLEAGPSKRSKLAISIIQQEGQRLGLFIDSLQDTEEQRRLWCDIWLPQVSSLLLSDSARCRNQTCNYHLPALLELAPWSLVPLLESMYGSKPSENQIAATMAVLCCAKRQGLARIGFSNDPGSTSEVELSAFAVSKNVDICKTAIVAIPPLLLSLCVSANSRELQIAGLSLSIESRSASSSLGKEEIEILKVFLTNNFSQSGSEARSSVASLFSKLMARLMASSYSAHRQLARKDAPEEDLESAQGVIRDTKQFLEWFVEQLSFTIHPSAPYHVARAGLSYLDMLASSGLDRTITLSPNARAKGPFFAEKAAKDPSSALAFPFSVTIVSGELVKRLLQCADSTYPDLQSSALELLSRFPAPLRGMEGPKAGQSILQKAVRLMVSTRESEGDAAASLASLYLEVYVKRAKWGWNNLVDLLYEQQGNDGPTMLDVEVQSPTRAHLRFLQDHLNLLDYLVAHAETGTLTLAAEERPLHATLKTLQHLFRGLDLSALTREETKQVMNRTIALVDGVWNVTRPILCNRAPEGFVGGDDDDGTKFDDSNTEMGRAVAAAEEKDVVDITEGDDEDTGAISKHQALLSYSWRGMKEASALLGLLVTITLTSRETGEGQDFWTIEELGLVGDRFNKWLSQVRHRGAFSTIYPAYSMAASALVKSGWAEAAALPRKWLSSFTEGVASGKSNISTTRRSAGIGYAVLALLCAMPNRTDKSVLHSTVRHLIDVASEDEGDIPARIHALNILRVLNADTSLSEHLRPYLGESLMLVIPQFTSSIWGIRNSAMMLFSQVCSRTLVMHMTNKDLNLTKTPWHEFFGRHAGLYDMLKDQVDMLAPGEEKKVELELRDSYQSSLFAILLLLSRLQTTDVTVEQKVANPLAFETLIERCLSSPIWKLREVASLAYCAMILPRQALDSAKRLMTECHLEDQNGAHGHLLVIQRLLTISRNKKATTADGGVKGSQVRRMMDSLDRGCDSWLKGNRCAATQIAFLETIQEASIKAEEQENLNHNVFKKVREFTVETLEELSKLPRSALLSQCRLPMKLMLYSTFARVAIGLSADGERDGLLRSLLNHPVVDVRRQAVKSLFSRISELQHTIDNELFAKLIAITIDSKEALLTRIDAAHAAASCSCNRNCLNSTQAGEMLERIERVAIDDPSVPLREAALPVFAGLISITNAKDKSNESGRALDKLCNVLSGLAAENQPFESRLTVVRSLGKICNQLVSDNAVQYKSAWIHASRPIFRAQLAVMKLVEDDDEEVREEMVTVLGDALKSSFTNQRDPILKSAERCAASSEATLERMWAWMERSYEGKGLREWRDYVWHLLCPNEEEWGRMRAQAFGKDSSLFAEERPNQFIDSEKTLRRALAYCSRHPPLEDVSKLLSQTMRQAEDVLAHTVKDKGVRVGLAPRNLFARHQLATCIAFGLEALLAHSSFITDEPSREMTERAKGLRRSLSKQYIINKLSLFDHGDDDENADPTTDDKLSAGARSLNIAMVSDFFFPNVGGVEGHIYMLSQRLLERGHKVIVITHSYPPDRVGVRYLSSGLKVYYVPYKVIARQDTLPNFFSFLPLLRQILLRENIELVHSHQALSSMGLESILHARTLGLKTIFTDHSLFGFADAASILTNKLLRFLLSDVDGVITVSHTGKENTTLRAELDPNLVYVVPNAVEADQFPPRRKTDRDGNRVTIVVLSRLMYRKGIDLLLACIPRLCALHKDLHFIIGGDGPKRIELEQMRERFDLHNRVQLSGAIRTGQVGSHLRQGQIFLNTSLTEAFGTGIIEAACSGLFVVSTTVGGIPEVLPDSMILLAQPDEDDIVATTSQAIEMIQNSQSDKNKNGQEQRFLLEPDRLHQSIRQMYSWQKTAQRVEQVYWRAMEREEPSLLERFQMYHRGGPIAGKIFVIVVAVEVLFCALLQTFWPTENIEMVDKG